MAGKLTDSQNSGTTAPSGRELYHLQFSLQTASPENFGYTLVRNTKTKYHLHGTSHEEPFTSWKHRRTPNTKQITLDYDPILWKLQVRVLYCFVQTGAASCLADFDRKTARQQDRVRHSDS
jgi:hypothetical protein